MRSKKIERRCPVELVFAVGRVGGQHASRARFFASGCFAIEYVFGAVNHRAHQMLKRYRETGTTSGPIEQEQGNSRRAKRILALARGKAHLVSLDAELLGERFAQRDRQRIGAGAAQSVLRLKLENVGGDFQSQGDITLDAKRPVVAWTPFLALPITQGPVTNERRWRRRQPAFVAISLRPSALQTDRVAGTGRSTAIRIVDETFPAASVAPDLRHGQAPPLHIARRNDRILRRCVGKRHVPCIEEHA